MVKSFRFKQHSVLPGFGLALGFAVFYLSLIVLIPLSALVFRTAGLSWGQFVGIVTAPRVLASYRVTFGSAIVAAIINSVFGVLVAWVLVRYRFPGRRFVDALVDLPFALPTAVAGITLATIYSPNGWVGRYLDPLGIKIAFTPLGITLAMTFIGLPFVVRTVQPVVEEIDRIRRVEPEYTITVVVPEFVPGNWWENLLHNQTALRLKANLLRKPHVVVISIPYHLDPDMD